MIGICFCLIIVRVGGRVDQAVPTQHSSQSSSNPNRHTFIAHNLDSTESAILPMSVHITKGVKQQGVFGSENASAELA